MQKGDAKRTFRQENSATFAVQEACSTTSCLTWGLLVGHLGALAWKGLKESPQMWAAMAMRYRLPGVLESLKTHYYHGHDARIYSCTPGNQCKIIDIHLRPV